MQKLYWVFLGFVLLTILQVLKGALDYYSFREALLHDGTNIVDIKESLQDESACEDFSCRDRLNGHEKLLYMECLQKVRVNVGADSPRDNGCRFLVTEPHKPVALVSFPGSGNTWVRQLLEGATGICTGSVMCDMSLRFDGFTGENVYSGSTLVVKTHEATPAWLTEPLLNITSSGHPKFESAIILIRNPLDAFISEWNRRVANNFKSQTVFLNTHTWTADKKYFGECCMLLDAIIFGHHNYRAQ